MEDIWGLRAFGLQNREKLLQANGIRPSHGGYSRDSIVGFREPIIFPVAAVFSVVGRFAAGCVETESANRTGCDQAFTTATDLFAKNGEKNLALLRNVRYREGQLASAR